MSSNETKNIFSKIGVGLSPNEADYAIAPINESGAIGLLNSIVLRSYGYEEKQLPSSKELKDGYSILTEKGKKTIFFVVTVNKFETAKNLEYHLFQLFSKYRKWFHERTVWIPLMGTGAGGLSLEESYETTIKIIEHFQTKFEEKLSLILSLPNESEGINFLQKINRNQNDENEIIDTYGRNFYIVGSYWEGEEQLNRFFKNDIWENGHEEKFSTIVNSVLSGDILFCKSTYASGNDSFLRIKGIGFVIENPLDGRNLVVNWAIKDIQVDILGLGHFRNTISKLSLSYTNKMINSLENSNVRVINFLNTVNEVHENINLKNDIDETIESINQIKSRNIIPGLTSDKETGEDYLDISKDVLAFSRVMAAKSFEPPLAIALFGKWGSGKSFFMRKLKAQIERFSENDSIGNYCKGVAHIHFNAWSYLDANLWASLVTRIFEGLNEYITNNTKSGVVIKEVEKQLNQQLTISKEEITLLENQKVSIEQQLTNLETQKKEITKTLEGNIDKIKKNTIWNIVDTIDKNFNATPKILEALKENESFVKTEAELKNIVPKKYWDNPNLAYEESKSKYIFLKEFFSRDKIKCNLIGLVLILIIIFISPIVIKEITSSLVNFNFTLPQVGISFLITIGAIWKRAETTYKKLQPIIASFWSVKENYNKKKDEVISKFEQEEKALKFEIEKSISEIKLITNQIAKTEEIKNTLEYKINNALATEALYTFIERRCSSDDYKKQLGIVSIIRRDFEILNDLLVGHNLETEKQEEAQKFKDNFKKPLERIILYIDDLDRCPEENVVQVLEAVNLLMAYPLFIVVVGVDPRWVKNALLKKYYLQFGGKVNEFANNVLESEMIEPADYLEKIFQVPFHLKDAEDLSVKEMIKNLLLTNKIYEPVNRLADIVFEGRAEVEMFNKIQSIKKDEIEIKDEIKLNIPNTLIDKPELLELSEREIEFMQDMSEIIGNNPRAIKRFVNIYRIVKAHENFEHENNKSENETLVVLFLLALSVGKHKKLLLDFQEFIENDFNGSKTLSSFLSPNALTLEQTALKHSLDVILSNKNSYSVLQNESTASFLLQNEFIQRFTFKTL